MPAVSAGVADPGVADVEATAPAAIVTVAAAVIAVAVAAVVVVAAAAERAADHAGHDTADDRARNRGAIAIVDLLDGSVGPDRLRSGRAERSSQGRRETEEQAGGNRRNSNKRHVKSFGSEEAPRLGRE
jgi:hypothetical protein